MRYEEMYRLFIEDFKLDVDLEGRGPLHLFENFVLLSPSLACTKLYYTESVPRVRFTIQV